MTTRRNIPQRNRKYVLTILLGIFIIGIAWIYYSFVRSESPEDLATRIIRGMNACQENGRSKACYRDFAGEVLRANTPKAIMESLSAVESEPAVFSRCHEVSHYIGRAAYETYGSIAQAFTRCTPSCHGGCYHGVVEAFLKDDAGSRVGSDTWLTNRIPTICGAVESFTNAREYGECLHGVGHALMFVSNADLSRSLSLCDALSTSDERETCYGGVFMENSVSSTLSDHPSAYVQPDDTTFPCRILAMQYQKVCYQYQSSLFDELTGGDWQETMERCRMIPEKYQGECFRFIGSNQVSRVLDVSELLSICRASSLPTLRRTCTEGVLVGTAGRFLGDRDRLYRICELAESDDRYSCYATMGSLFRSFTDKAETVQAWCDGIGIQEYERICKSSGS